MLQKVVGIEKYFPFFNLIYLVEQKIFLKILAESLFASDKIIITDIYPAREKPIKGDFKLNSK